MTGLYVEAALLFALFFLLPLFQPRGSVPYLRSSDIRAFVGPGADPYVDYYEECHSKQRKLFRFNWRAYLFIFAYGAYRKSWMPAALMGANFLVNALVLKLTEYDIHLPALFGAGTISIIWNRYYIFWLCRRAIAEAGRKELGGAERERYLANEGGVSKQAGIGALFVYIPLMIVAASVLIRIVIER